MSCLPWFMRYEEPTESEHPDRTDVHFTEQVEMPVAGSLQAGLVILPSLGGLSGCSSRVGVRVNGAAQSEGPDTSFGRVVTDVDVREQLV